MSLKLSIDSPSTRPRLTWRSQAALAPWAGAPTAGMGRRREPLVRAWLGSKKARLCQPVPCSIHTAESPCVHPSSSSFYIPFRR